MVQPSAINWLNNLRYPSIFIAFFAMCLSLFFQFPNITYLKQQVVEGKVYMWKAVEDISESPFTKKDYEAGSHEEKKVFRLTLPLLGKPLGLKTLGFYLFQCILGFFTLLMTSHLIKKITGDTLTALFFTAGISCIYFGCSAFIDVFGFTDSTAYFFLLLAMITRNPLLIFTSLFLASWADERGLIASSLVFLWFSTYSQEYNKLGDILKVNKQTVAVVLSWVVFLVSRFAFTYFLEIDAKAGRIGPQVVIENIGKIQLSLWTGFEAFWILFVVFLVFALQKRHYWMLFFLVGGYLLIFAVSFMVLDTTKSLAYGTIGLFIMVAYLKQYIGMIDMRKYIAGIAVVCIVSPTIFIINTIMYTSPLYQEVFQFLTNRLLG